MSSSHFVAGRPEISLSTQKLPPKDDRAVLPSFLKAFFGYFIKHPPQKPHQRLDESGKGWVVVDKDDCLLEIHRAHDDKGRVLGLLSSNTTVFQSYPSFEKGDVTLIGDGLRIHELRDDENQSSGGDVDLPKLGKLQNGKESLESDNDNEVLEPVIPSKTEDSTKDSKAQNMMVREKAENKEYFDVLDDAVTEIKDAFDQEIILLQVGSHFDLEPSFVGMDLLL